jgi:hypothetical protein
MFLWGEGCSPTPGPQNWETTVSLFVWVTTFDLSGVGDPTISYDNVRIALRII